MRWQAVLFTILGIQQLAQASTVTPDFKDSNPDMLLTDNLDEQIQLLFGDIDDSEPEGRNLATASGPNQPFTQAEQRAALNVVNSARIAAVKKNGASNMIKLSINRNLTLALQEFMRVGGADWGYQNSAINQPRPGERRYLNFRDLNKNSTFIGIANKYPDLGNITTRRIWPLHDTFKSFIKNGFLRIVRLRADQDDCFIYQECLKSPAYFNYIPCMKYKNPNFEAVPKSCMYTNLYYPHMVDAQAVQFAIVKMFRRGEFVKDQAQNRAWLILLVFNNNTEPTTNIPFLVGGACSKCPPGFTRCEHGLCAADLVTPTPTSRPTQKPSLRVG